MPIMCCYCCCFLFKNNTPPQSDILLFTYHPPTLIEFTKSHYNRTNLLSRPNNLISDRVTVELRGEGLYFSFLFNFITNVDVRKQIQSYEEHLTIHTMNYFVHSLNKLLWIIVASLCLSFSFRNKQK